MIEPRLGLEKDRATPGKVLLVGGRVLPPRFGKVGSISARAVRKRL
jgi:hypothetical protein